MKQQKTADPLTVRCPHCDASPRAGCRLPNGYGARPHRARRELANRPREPVPNLTRGGYKPDSARAWRGKSYRKGGERVRELRDQEKRKDCKA